MDSYEQTVDDVMDVFSSLGEDRAAEIAAMVAGEDGQAVVQAVSALNASTLQQVAVNKVEILQVDGGGEFNIDSLPSTVKVLVFSEPVVINGKSFQGTVLLGPGDDKVNFSLIQAASENANGVDVDPGAGNNTVVATAGADIVRIGQGAHDTVEGGGGVDTLKIAGKVAEFALSLHGSALVAEASSAGTSVQATNAEILQFDDGVVVVASNQNEAALARLYEFLFGRTPDADGMKWWLETMRETGISVVDAAAGFLYSQEAREHGITASSDISTFLDEIYQQGFGRAADAQGKAWWADQMANHGVTHAEVVAGFAASEEAGILITGVKMISDSI